MNNLDISIVAIYLLALFAWAIYLGLKETADDYLVFSRKAPMFLVMFSIISTWVGVGTTVSTAASGYDTGISLAVTAATGGFLGILVASWFAPKLKWFGDKFKAHTLGDFIFMRYSKNAMIVASFLMLIIYIMLTAAQFVGLSILVEIWTGINFKIIVIFAAISTILYTAFAGIKSDFYTDVIHLIVMFIVLFFILFPLTIQELGDIKKIFTLPSSYFDPFAYGGVSFFIAGIIFGIGSVFVTMEFWQRIYASKNSRSAKNALIISMFIIVLFYSISAFFGLSAAILLPGLEMRDQALFALMNEFLPTGLLGLGLAGFMAIFISTVNSTIMVASAILSKDIYINMMGKNNNKLLNISRISTLVVGMFGLIIAINIPDIVALSVNALLMLIIILPSIIGGFFWKKATSTASFSSISGGIISLIIFSFIDSNTAFAPAFIISLIIFVVVSYFTKNNSSEQLNIVQGWKNDGEKNEL